MSALLLAAAAAGFAPPSFTADQGIALIDARAAKGPAKKKGARRKAPAKKKAKA